jgi:transcriptional regulator with XRE-family HTH domain
MMEKSNKKWMALSDSAVVETIGLFIRHNRLQQNLTQSQLAKEAGINRTTLSQFENGTSSNILTFISLLRALKLMSVLEVFRLEQQISPLQLAKIEQSRRKRASIKEADDKTPKSDW